MEVMIH